MNLPGMGKRMPVIMWCFTLASLTLIGIPPTGGFVSKWYIASAALDSGLTAFNWLVPVILLISALLTAGYLLPITISSFFPKKDEALLTLKREESPLMWVPLVILAGICVILGMFSGGLTGFVSQIASVVA